jgi:hypothetical protein
MMSKGPSNIVCGLEPKERHAGMPSNPNPGAEVLEVRPLQRRHEGGFFLEQQGQALRRSLS